MTNIDFAKIKNLNEAISKHIDYKFQNETILLEALTHPSMYFVDRTKTYERLEFLGDSILNMIVTAILFKLFPHEQEGALAQRKRALICGRTIADIAEYVKLGDFLLMSKPERAIGGHQNKHNLENALEALIGAIYLDGGFNKVKTFVHRHWRPLAESMLDLDPPQDFRSALQEWTQERGLPLPRYQMTKQMGSKHQPRFMVSLQVDRYGKVNGCASTIKDAEQEAAKLMLQKVGVN